MKEKSFDLWEGKTEEKVIIEYYKPYHKVNDVEIIVFPGGGYCCYAEHEGIKEGAEILGVHMEGPFLTEKYKGGMRTEEMMAPSIEVFETFEKVSGNTVKMVTLAPEASGATELIKYLSKKGIVASLGHTAATFEQVANAVCAGASCITHTYNAQSPLHHREIGVVGAHCLWTKCIAS